MNKEKARSTFENTEHAFQAFLYRLSSDPLQAAAIYNKTRQKLIFLFEGHSNAARFAVELADQTMDRLVRLTEAQEEITNFVAYAKTVGRYVLKEFWKKMVAETLVADVPEPRQINNESDKRLLFLEQCLDKLRLEDREIILTYHGSKGSEKITGHRDSAAKLNLTSEALRTRACRIRGKLETCVELAIQNSTRSNVSTKTATWE